MVHFNTIVLRNPLHLLFQIIIHAFSHTHPLLHLAEVEEHVTRKEHELEHDVAAVVAPALGEGEVTVFSEGSAGPVAGDLDAVDGGTEVLVVTLDLKSTVSKGLRPSPGSDLRF